MKAEALSSNTSFLTRILYGGITEGLLLRWGMLTLLVWVAKYLICGRDLSKWYRWLLPTLLQCDAFQ